MKSQSYYDEELKAMLVECPYCDKVMIPICYSAEIDWEYLERESLTPCEHYNFYIGKDCYFSVDCACCSHTTPEKLQTEDGKFLCISCFENYMEALKLLFRA